jgi:hypothetical protein
LPRNGPGISANFAAVTQQRLLYTLQYSLLSTVSLSSRTCLRVARRARRSRHLPRMTRTNSLSQTVFIIWYTTSSSLYGIQHFTYVISTHSTNTDILGPKGYPVLGWDDIFLLSKSSRPPLGPTQPPIRWASEVLSPEVKQPWREANHSLVTSAEVKNTWILYTQWGSQDSAVGIATA